ncbi:MAG: dienelactone hydrolase family protein [Candidatus Ancillula sp.]|jgi:predicted esterase|nr:dienelactone hydrolase family protein [Candidatus Ancillula sp.]
MTRDLAILLHGYGSNADDMQQLGVMINNQLSANNKFGKIVALQGLVDLVPALTADFGEPFGSKTLPFMQSMYSWTTEMIPEVDNLSDQSASEIDKAVNYINAQIREIRKEAIASGQIDFDSRVVLIGFSQGGMMSIEILRSGLLDDLCNVAYILLSPVLANSKLSKEKSKNTKVFLGYGLSDDVVDNSLFKKIEQILPEPTVKTYTGAVHEVTLQEISDIANFLE